MFPKGWVALKVLGSVHGAQLKCFYPAPCHSVWGHRDTAEAGSAEKTGTYLARHIIIPQVSSAALRLFPLGVLKMEEGRGRQ